LIIIIMALKDLTLIKTHLFFCNGGTCKNKGAEEATAEIRRLIVQSGLGESVHTTKTLCNGRCKDGPIIISQPEGLWFREMTMHKAEFFVQQYLIKGRVPERIRLYRYGEPQINVAESSQAVEG
jgi:(2Fe-2S) ferredoxin